MGGKKKLNLKQMERASQKKDDAPQKKAAAIPEKKAPGIFPPDAKSEKVISELKKMKALTPYAVASRFNIRLSVAKDLLEKLAQQGIIEYISGSKNIKIYRPCD